RLAPGRDPGDAVARAALDRLPEVPLLAHRRPVQRQAAQIARELTHADSLPLTRTPKLTPRAPTAALAHTWTWPNATRTGQAADLAQACFSHAGRLSAAERPHRLEVRTPPFQGGNAGSIPAGDATLGVRTQAIQWLEPRICLTFRPG